MSQLVVASLALACFLLLPEPAGGRWTSRASPRLLATGHLVRLIGLGVLPAGWLACLAVGFAGLIGHGPGLLGDGCWLGLSRGTWRLLVYGTVLLALAPLGWQATSIVRSAARLRPGDLERVLASKHRLRGGGVVWIVPSEEVMAYAGGFLRPYAVVTTGLLDLLTPLEREAVLEHEGAHLRFGHPYLLMLGAVVARAYGFLPVVRRAWDGLNLELEASADDEAARLVGAAPLATALARVGLTAAAAAPALAAGGHLRHRLRRLQEPGRRRCTPANAIAGVLGAMLVAAFGWSACALLVRDPVLPGLALCTAAMAAVGLRPTWPWPYRQR